VDDPCQIAARNIDLEAPHGEHKRGVAEVFGLFVALILVAEIAALAVLRVVAPGAPVLTLAVVVPLTLVVALLARYWANSAAYRTSRLSEDRDR
jgi:membrane protein implicated in regulation of membrane protease activity